jgi:antitoxin component YwqK of YwqJK toxin-antitoxin module
MRIRATKKALLCVLALIAVGCADPTPRNLDGLVQQGEVYLDRETMRPYSGPVFDFFPYDTTRIERRMNLKDGKLDGPLEQYYENGQLSSKSNYVAGEQDGPFERYHENGQLGERDTYVAGELDGLFEMYYENGQLMVRGTYVAGNKPDGLYEVYYENGQLRHKGTYNMGQKCGEWFEDGETVTYDPCPDTEN